MATASAVLVAAPPAHAQSSIYVITSLGDAPDASPSDGACATAAGDCTLRAAIQQAEADAPNGADDIDFGIPGQINLTAPLPALTTSMNITGTTSRNTVARGDGTGNYRIFSISDGATVSIDHLVVSNGYAAGSSYPADSGGGIYVGGSTLIITNSVVSGNTANRSGGGIMSDSGTVTIANTTIGINFATMSAAVGNSSGSLTVTASTLQSNHASYSGGAFYGSTGLSPANTTFTDCTFAGNVSGGNGGAITNDYGSSVSVVNSTFSGNAAGTGSVGGAVYSYAGQIALTNTTISGNTAGSTGAGIYGSSVTLLNSLVALNTTPGGNADLNGSFTSDGNNLIGDGDGSLGLTNGANGDQVGTGTNPIDPKLDSSLADNGGPTRTLALLPGSPAIDAGSDSVLATPDNLTTDQRGDGFPRSQGSHVDIGAFETPAPSVTLTKPAAGAQLRGSSSPVSATADDASGIREVDFLVDGNVAARVTSPTSGTTYSTTFDTTMYADGSHVITARAIDAAGYSTDASVTAIIDNTSPVITNVAPLANAIGVAPSTNVTVTFSEAMRARSINRTSFNLYKKGASTPIAASISYLPGTHKAVLNPIADLPRGTTYRAVLNTRVQDLAGNHLSTTKAWYFTTHR